MFITGYGEYFQTILVQPQSTEVAVGETVVLDCTVFNQYGDVAWYVKIIEKASYLRCNISINRCKDGHCTMGRERPLYFIPRYEIIGDKQAGMYACMQ